MTVLETVALFKYSLAEVPGLCCISSSSPECYCFYIQNSHCYSYPGNFQVVRVDLLNVKHERLWLGGENYCLRF